MNNSKLTPLLIFTFSLILLTGCTGQPQVTQPTPVQEPQAKEPVVTEPQNIEYNGHVVTPRCQEICLDQWEEARYSAEWSLEACHILCEDGRY